MYHECIVCPHIVAHIMPRRTYNRSTCILSEYIYIYICRYRYIYIYVDIDIYIYVDIDIYIYVDIDMQHYKDASGKLLNTINTLDSSALYCNRSTTIKDPLCVCKGHRRLVKHVNVSKHIITPA